MKYWPASRWRTAKRVKDQWKNADRLAARLTRVRELRLKKRKGGLVTQEDLKGLTRDEVAYVNGRGSNYDNPVKNVNEEPNK